MDIVGKIILAMPEVTGTSQRGTVWKKREYVLETVENYPKKIFFDFFGERADLYPLQVGQMVRLYFDIDSREYNGRWFVSIRGWKAEDPNLAAQNAAAGAGQPGYGAPAAYGAPAQPAAYGAPTQPDAYGAPAQAPYPGAPTPYPTQAPAPGAVPPPPAIGGDNEDLPF